MPFLELNNLTCRFGDKAALLHFNLSVKKGEIMSLLGPSGCGKTTTLRLIAGFLSPSEGKILIQGRDVTRCLQSNGRWEWCFSLTLFSRISTYLKM